jgi:hypothetical protein
MIKKIIRIYVTFLQRILVGISLFFIYFIGFGATRLFLVFFGRKTLYGPGGGWQAPEGYDGGLDDCRRGS